MKFLSVFVVLLGLAAPAGAQADVSPVNAEKILTAMENGSAGAELYLTGTLHGLRAANFNLARSGLPKQYCEPTGGVSVQEVAALMRRKLQADPELWKVDTAGVVLLALLERYPCR